MRSSLASHDSEVATLEGVVQTEGWVVSRPLRKIPDNALQKPETQSRKRSELRQQNQPREVRAIYAIEERGTEDPGTYRVWKDRQF